MDLSTTWLFKQYTTSITILIINRKIQSLDTEEQIKQELELATYVTKELEKTVKDKGRKGTR